jgi:hypothetical protein
MNKTVSEIDQFISRRAQIMRMVCRNDRSLWVYCYRGPRFAIVCEPGFPYKSLQAYYVLRGDLLNDDRGGSYCMRRLLVIRIAAHYGLRVVTTREGVKMWSDDERIDP